MKDTLQYLFEGNKLTREEAKSSLLEVGKGQHSEAEFASFLTVFKMRPLESEELAGFRDAMFELSARVDLSEFNGMDIVGTGGDGKNTFNISTLACFVVAGSGVNITKHGNYAASSNSGSSNVLEYLGYKFSSDIHKLKGDLEKGNFCFLHAPLFHPAMKHIAPVRRALKVPTFFNILGPMINPSAPKYQVLGVNNSENFMHYKNVYESLAINFAIVHSIDGYDEISLTANTRLGLKGTEKYLTAEDFNLESVRPEKLFGGTTIEEAAKIFTSVLEGKGTKEQTNVVLANAGLALQVVYPEKELTECVAMARESLDSGKALQCLKSVIQ
ncbi:anthranilate phosphoribosyltransferase [Maribellus sediminis]|uniref:anthranilate phosphoribosyltransferase n=1 Tax=Maribellus sediminis TaxID=2696285 RepID=UPI001430DD97|nr:anthranilate phosphoribosyltransferase [Maribellus sediminis]